jgi:hypothetical protein
MAQIGLSKSKYAAYCQCPKLLWLSQNAPDGQLQPNVSYTLCNSNATVETQRLWTVLCTEYGKRAMSGVVANVDWNTRETEYVYQWTGKYPALKRIKVERIR